jgi:hypothetical protein
MNNHYQIDFFCSSVISNINVGDKPKRKNEKKKEKKKGDKISSANEDS